MNLFVAYVGPGGCLGNIVIKDLEGETIETMEDIRKIRDHIHSTQELNFPKVNLIITNFIWLEVK